MSKPPQPLEEIDYNHPISNDIVRELSNYHNIPRGLIHEVLEDIEELWEPHRYYLARALNRMGSTDNSAIAVYGHPDEEKTVLVNALTVVPLLERINLDAHIEVESVSKLGITHAVMTAHALETERILSDTYDTPVVIRTPEDYW